MRMIHCITAVAVAAATFQAHTADDLDIAPAMTAAAAWLATVDAGKYGQSWDEASPLLQQALPKRQWETTLAPARAPLGALVVRKLKSATYTTAIPGAPEGQYVVIVYDARFENRPVAFETVTPMREKDGTWKIAGYFIR
jgi:Protein of unknown function (DUF4019)